MILLLGATLTMLIVCTIMVRVSDKQIADRDRRINALMIEVASADEQCESWQAEVRRLQRDVQRQVDLRIMLDDALEDAHERTNAVGREAVAAQQAAYRERVRANRAEGGLKMIARAVGAPADHPDVADKIMERLIETGRAETRRLS